MPFKLSGLMLNRVDLCPDGSNPDAHIVLFKSKEGHMPAPKKKVVAKKGQRPSAKPQSKSKKKLEDDDEEEDEEEDDAINKADDEEDDEDLDDDEEEADDDDDDEPVQKGGRRKEDNKDDDEEDKKKKRKKKLAKKMAKAADDEDDDDLDADDDDEELDDEDELVGEEVMKTLPKSVQLIIAKQNDRLRQASKLAKEASAAAAVERDRRESLEFVEKAKRDIPNLTGTDEEKGDLLKALFSGKPLETKVAKAVVKLLKAGDAAVKSLLHSETGSRRARSEDDDDPISQLREKADEVLKANKNITREQAFEKACQDNPDLFREYRIEKRRASREVN